MLVLLVGRIEGLREEKLEYGKRKVGVIIKRVLMVAIWWQRRGVSVGEER